MLGRNLVGAKTSTLCISALVLAYSAVKYAAPVWCRSKHTRKLDVALDDTMRAVTGCLQPTPTECLSVLAAIPPPSLRRVKLTFKLLLLITRLLPKDGRMAENHRAPEAGQLPRAWTRGRSQTESRQRVSGAKSP